MLWLLPAFIRTVLYVFGCPVGGFMPLFSSVLYGAFLLCVVPAYFLYAGPEAALRLSLLLCIHSLVLMMMPKILKTIIPMLEVVLFIALLFLPVNVTPPIAIWFYEKIIYVSSPILSVFEAINIVLVIMRASQMVVDRMEEQPTLAKSLILGTAALTFALGSCLAYYIYNVYNSHSINRIIEAVVVVCGVLLVVSLIKDEGIISDVPCVYFVMMCVVWALAKESSVAKARLATPSVWLKKIPKELSFLDIIFSIANSGFVSFTQVKAVFFLLVSPCLLLMAGLRVLCLGYLLQQAMRKFKEGRSYDSDDDTDNDDDDSSDNFNISPNNVYYFRLVVIFVVTELLLRTVFNATSYSSNISGPPHSFYQFLDEWWNHTEMVKTFLDFRVWRIVQLSLLAVVYFYKLVIDSAADEDYW